MNKFNCKNCNSSDMTEKNKIVHCNNCSSEYGRVGNKFFVLFFSSIFIFLAFILSFSFSEASYYEAFWGTIKGTITDQTDLQDALNLKSDKSNVLELDNTDSFTPDADYEPATKKYVDDNIISRAVDSVFGRVGEVVAQANDYTWAQIDKTTSDLADLATKSHTSLTEIGTNTHAQLDTHIANVTTNPHSVDQSDVGLGNVDNTSDANKPVSTATQTALDGKVDENAPITGDTKTKVTYDSKGLVTSGDDATTADINDSTDRRYVTDAEAIVIGNTSGTNTGDQSSGDFDHNSLQNTHNLTTDIDHDALTNYVADEHVDWVGDSGITTENLQTTGFLSVGPTGDTFSTLLKFWRNGEQIGQMDNSSSNIRFKAAKHVGALADNAFQILNYLNDGFEINKDSELDLVGNTTLSSAFQTAIDHNSITNTHNLTTDIDHGSIAGLTDDDHSQYLLLAGRSGQTIDDDITVKGSTSDDTAYALKLDDSSDSSLFSVRNDGISTFYNTVQTSGVTEAGEGTQNLASTLYIQSRLQNLITNGSGLLGNNYNFADFTFDSTELHGGRGSFKAEVPLDAFSDELIPLDVSKRYRLSLWGKSGEDGGINYDPSARQYVGFSLYDIDGLIIWGQYSTKVEGSTDAVLAVDLNPGDTTITLDDATGWNDGASSNLRWLNWFGYTNSFGYTYPDYTYTRNVLVNAWGENGIVGNVITLNVPWAGPALSAGDALRNTRAGSSYKYIATYTLVPNEWKLYEGYIEEPAVEGLSTGTEYRAGTAYMKIVLLNNRNNPINNNIRWSDISLTELSSENLELASATQQGVVSLANQTMGDGEKYFQDDVGIGQTSPTARTHIKGSTSDSSAYALKVDDSSNSNLFSVRNDGVLTTNGARVKDYEIHTGADTLTNSDNAIQYGDTDGGAFTLTLPASPTDGLILTITNTGTSGNVLTIARNGNNINSQASDITAGDGVSTSLQFTSDDWIIIN